jgi:hypothetical protein
MTVLPVDVQGPGSQLSEALDKMFVRVARLSRKRPSPIDMAIGPASIGLIAAFDGFYNGKLTIDEACERINRVMADGQR